LAQNRQGKLKKRKEKEAKESRGPAVYCLFPGDLAANRYSFVANKGNSEKMLACIRRERVSRHEKEGSQCIKGKGHNA